MHVVMLTAHRLEGEILAAFASGADAYCLKSTNPCALRLAVHAAAIGPTYLDPDIAHVVLNRAEGLDAASDFDLSRRELEVLKLISEGSSNREIADELHVSVATVKASVQEILSKLSASDRTQAAVKALRMRLI